MSRTDEELDRDWKPNGRRPQSTIAKVFSEELSSLFRIDNSVADLDEQVDKRKKEIDSRTSELEALERRIREMEQRLKGAPVVNTQVAGGAQQSGTLPPPEKDKYGGSRPGTARQSQQAVPGALPPTPVGSEGEYRHHHHHHPPLALRNHQRPPSGHAARGYSPISTSSRGGRSGGGGGGDDSDSIISVPASVSSSLAFADYVIVPGPSDGDREQRQT
ncbi:hypothetical protein QBC35DRAFT_453477 [Podospora australis]|uniref:Uncharacterized protein n=1 Tax=Podospora australis TaxID=1536484 RepID=A0AAN7AGZ4_9PEZI|nr:hypothetical protein QBC35DRAFT_453477 [Podospora australis]